jgi:hypothetical protein
MLMSLIATAVLAAAPAAGAEAQHEHSMMDQEKDKAIPGDSPIFKNVNLKIESPKEDEVVPGPDLEIKFDLKGYELPGEGPGPHIHVIIDNQPYVPDYDASKPFTVKGLAEGSHTLRAFPSRPWHESIKAPHAFALVHFFVGKKPAKPFANWPDAKKALLTFSRPKGNYAGDDAKKVMVDFWLSNAKLGAKGDKVHMIFDGKESDITEWKPQWVEGLADGEHKISLDLIDAKGKPVENVFNHTERTFTINAPPPAGAPAPAAPAPAPAAPAPAPAPAPGAK